MKKYVEQFKSLEKGKKIKLIAVFVLLLLVLYLIFSMFGGSSSSYSTENNATSNSTVQNKIVTKRLIADVAIKRKVEKPQRVTHNLSKKQKAYLSSVNELQSLQLQQQIAQTKQQIAAAELQAAQSNKKRQSLVAPPQKPVFEKIENAQPTAPVVVSPTISNNLNLQYIANIGGKWQVIISSNGKLINGTLGTILPDGSKIAKINGSSITLNLDGQTKKLTINNAI